MPASFLSVIKKPAVILFGSFVFGLWIDAMAERLSAQTLKPFFEGASAIQQDETTDPIGVQDSDQDEDIQYEIPDIEDLATDIVDIKIQVFDPSDNKPEDRSQDLFAEFGNSNYPNSFQQRLAMWRAPDIRYQPLYFEHVALERYGQTHHPLVQPWCSAVHGTASMVLLPYNMFFERPGSCVYPLGFCRPGSLAPRTHTRWLWAHGFSDIWR